MGCGVHTYILSFLIFLNMSDPRYHDGDVVWCKCGGLFWPGEVKGLASLPEDIREGFLRTPLVVVKFFDEDG